MIGEKNMIGEIKKKKTLSRLEEKVEEIDQGQHNGKERRK